MKPHSITPCMLADFGTHLREEGYAQGTIEKYARDLRAFWAFMQNRPVSRMELTAWKEQLLNQSKAPVTVNGALAAINSFCAFLGWNECHVKYVKVQRRLFRDASRELTRDEYQRLLDAAYARGDMRLALVLETICSTGIRVSELRYITVEAIARRRAEISLKGKIRTVLIPGKLCKKLLKYVRTQKIASGEIFLTASGKSLSRRQIWGDMKRLCKWAGVNESKVFPHNLRHLFARAFYKVCKDIVRLADVLGHSNIETTRIYLISTGNEHARLVERLHLIL